MRPYHPESRTGDGYASRRAFTLVELLVVITIIGILAGLLIAAAAGALGTANQTAIALEMNIVGQSIEQYRNDLAGGSYPPDIGVGPLSGPNAAPAAVRDSIENDFIRHFNRTFPRHREPQELLRAMAGVRRDPPDREHQAEADNPNLPFGMNPSEALVFYLQKFSSDPQFPISGSGGPSFVVQTSPLPEDLASRNWIGNFEPSRYGMLQNGVRRSVQEVYDAIDADGSGDFDATELEGIPRFVRYEDPRDSSVTRQINFWQYFPPNSPQPLVYFDASRGIHDVNHNGSFDATVHALKALSPGATDPLVSNVTLANEGKFQILHAGLDEQWGNFAPVQLDPSLAQDAQFTGLLFPDGPFTLELADTIVNFSDRGTLEDSQP